MKWMHGASFALLSMAALQVQATWISPFISEIHYDNKGTDVSEFVAVTAPAGLSLDGWSLLFYNGKDGKSYMTEPLGGTVLEEAAGWGEIQAMRSEIQNGPDGVALVAPNAAVIDFIAYGELFNVTAGPALGLQARLLPLEEGGHTEVGWSLQRVGMAHEWSWLPAEATPGRLNPGLVLADARAVPSFAVPGLLLAGLLGWRAAQGLSRPAGGTPQAA